MNEHFVNVKVDREERPDVDQIYQTAHALMTRRSGGWPLTVFMTPQGDPFFAGTYFPKDGRHGLPGLRELLPHVARVYREKGDVIAAQGGELRRALASLEPDAAIRRAARRRASSVRSTRCVRRSTRRTAGSEAHRNSRTCPTFASRFRAHVAKPASGALPIAALTALAMANGGIHDQLGGGFCRYSVDRTWHDPALREDALRQRAAARPVRRPRASLPAMPAFARAAEGIVAWLVARDARATTARSTRASMRTAKARKAGSTSGRATRSRALLTADEYAVAAPHFGLDDPPNFEGHAWNLRIAKPVARRRRPGGHRVCRGASAHRCVAREAASLRASGGKRPGRRRQDPHVVERAGDRRARARVAPARERPRGRSSRSTRSTRCSDTHGATAGCSRRARASARTSTPISTTTRSCSTRWTS